MSGVSLPVGRVSMQMQSLSLLSSLQADELSLQNMTQQLSTGNRLNLPSDDPVGTVGIMRLNQQINVNDQYTTNLNFANGSLSTADSTLQSVSNLLTSAQSLASSMIGANVTADQRSAQADVVNSYINQLLEYANTQYQNESIFGGQSTGQSPFVAVDGGYQYVGTTQGQSILSPGGSSLQYTLDGSSIFGGLSQVGAGQPLDPALTASTKLSDLSGARLQGVSLGTVNVTAGSTTVSVDLSKASTVSDVINLINAGLTSAGSDASVGFSGGSLTVTGDTTQSVTIADPNGSTTAADLGIATTVPAAGTYTGTGLAPKVTATTPLSSLNNGAGIDPSGFIITNGTKSATITLSGLSTVQDLLNKINSSGTNVTASIAPDGSGIVVQNALSGSALTIGENGGTTATQLGIRSMDASTQLSSLNLGAGVTFASANQAGPTGSILITQTDGTQFTVKADGITSPGGLIAAINSATGNTGITAAMNATGNGITLTDSSGGSGNIQIAYGSDYQANGTNLGLPTTGTGATLVGTDMTFSTDDIRITRQDGTDFTVNLSGAKTIQDVLNAINNADGNSGANKVTASLNATGNGIELSDASTGSGTLTVNALNGSTAAQQLGILGTASSSTPGVINGTDVNPVEPNGVFTSLVMLRNALLNNDTSGITQAAQLLQQSANSVIEANGVVGARQQDISSRLSSVSDEQTQLQSSLSQLQDTDMTTIITQYQQLQTTYEAALQVGARMNSMDLLDFLN